MYVASQPRGLATSRLNLSEQNTILVMNLGGQLRAPR